MTQNPTDPMLRKIFAETKTLACVGVSMNPIRPSYFVARYLSLKNFRVIPINPGHVGETLFGEEIYADLASIPKDIQIDIVDIFRRSEYVPPIVAQAIEHLPNLKTIWMQVGVTNAKAAEMATKAGLQMIENRCPKIEYQRLFGELRMAGFNTGIISSKL
ncbi:MAG: CoA-binding protein [Alphaproteobacteria bacterium]|nr:CoA-binding protein [Alphaproteobacteria bacterium]